MEVADAKLPTASVQRHRCWSRRNVWSDIKAPPGPVSLSGEMLTSVPDDVAIFNPR
jgi:hypothetical protein